MSAAISSASASNPWASVSLSPDRSTSQLSGACALLAVLVQAQCSTRAGARGDIELGFERLEELKKQLADSIRQAEEAANDSGFFGFLGDIFGSDIAQIAGAVAAVAATIATGGAAAPLLLIAISEALQVAAKVGAELGLDPKLCMGLAIAAVAVGFCSGAGAGQAAGEVADLARGVSLGAKITQGAATIAGSSLKIVSAHYRAEQYAHRADAALYQAEDEATDLALDDAFSRLQRALRVEQRALGTASEIVQDDAQTNTTLSSRI
jgi:hypothetical protein